MASFVLASASVAEGSTAVAPLFLGLIVDVIGTAIITVTSALIQHSHHHDQGGSNKPGSSDTSHVHGRDITDVSPHPRDMDYDFETPCCTPDMIMHPVNKRNINPIETPKPKRVYEEVDNKHDRDVRVVKHTGPSYTAGWCRDFSAIQRTRVNPVTGRIIGYKGIRRKRALSPTSKYSQFWREQKYAKPSFHAARSPGVWDSARRP